MNNKLIGTLCVAAMAMGLGMAQSVFAYSGTPISCEDNCLKKANSCTGYKCGDLYDMCMANCN